MTVISGHQRLKAARELNVQCGFWQDKEGKEFWMTREQIGGALGYNVPMEAISKIHKRHNERLNKFSVVDTVTTTDGKAYET